METQLLEEKLSEMKTSASSTRFILNNSREKAIMMTLSFLEHFKKVYDNQGKPLHQLNNTIQLMSAVNRILEWIWTYSSKSDNNVNFDLLSQEFPPELREQIKIEYKQEFEKLLELANKYNKVKFILLNVEKSFASIKFKNNKLIEYSFARNNNPFLNEQVVDEFSFKEAHRESIPFEQLIEKSKSPNLPYNDLFPNGKDLILFFNWMKNSLIQGQTKEIQFHDRNLRGEGFTINHLLKVLAYLLVFSGFVA